jgi:squalene/oxidosqualene cyclase-like protein
MNYVALRLLGVKADDPMLEKPRAFIQRHGGALYTPSWGKFYLCVLGAMEWSGVNSLMPELWLLPEWLPLRPSHWWCHCRMVYLPMAYCYGHRVTGPITPLVQAIRREIYVEPYDKIEWWRFREQVRPIDRYWPGSWLLKIVFPLSNAYERVHLPFLRRKALDFILAYVNAEDAQTNYIDIGPVNKVINMLCCWHAYGEQSEQLRRHRERLPDYLWLAEDGMKMQGYNGSQLWDTAFSVRALCDSGLAPLFPDTLRRAYAYFDVCQVDEETPMREKWFRHVAKGAWPFSTKPHGWPISDCTSEALQAALRAVESQLLDREPLAPERLYDAVNVIIAFQNKDGGMATYENTRGPAFLEKLNPSEVFGDIMIDYSYVECTSACIQALAVFRKHFPEHRSEEVARTIARARQFLIDKQRPDGSWYGSWAVCFTYGAWFAIQGLIDAGEDPEGPVVRKGCDFLVSKQMPDGGWGESYLSCVTKEYTPHAESQVINTAWALLALMKAGYRDESVIERGVRLLLQKQEANGDWAQQGISGVFNGNCMITYTNYRNIFPLWAVGRYLCIKTGGAPLARRGRQVQVADASAEGKADEPGASPVHVNGKGKKGKARK